MSKADQVGSELGGERLGTREMLMYEVKGKEQALGATSFCI